MGNLFDCGLKDIRDTDGAPYGFDGSSDRKGAASTSSGVPDKSIQVENPKARLEKVASNVKDEAAPVEEKGDFYLLCEESGSRVKEMMDIILEKYTELKHLTPINVSNMRQISKTTDLTILLPCIYASRLGTDIDVLYKKVGATAQGKVLLIIFHRLKANTYSVTPSSLVLDSSYKRPTKDIVDVIYHGNCQIVKCEHNDREIAKLMKHVGVSMKAKKDNITQSAGKKSNTNKNILGNNTIVKAQETKDQENRVSETLMPKNKSNVDKKELEKPTPDKVDANVEDKTKQESRTTDEKTPNATGNIEADKALIENDTVACTMSENETDENKVDNKMTNINTGGNSTRGGSTSKADAAIKNDEDEKSRL